MALNHKRTKRPKKPKNLSQLGWAWELKLAMGMGAEAGYGHGADAGHVHGAKDDMDCIGHGAHASMSLALPWVWS